MEFLCLFACVCVCVGMYLRSNAAVVTTYFQLEHDDRANAYYVIASIRQKQNDDVIQFSLG